MQYLKCKVNKDIEEKHKENLYSLLVSQLQKNILINGLRLNFMQRKRNNKMTLSRK